MGWHRPRKRNPLLLLLLLAAALAYEFWLHSGLTITGRTWLDGTMGVMLGLYICSRPVANLLDIILFGGLPLAVDAFSNRSQVAWLSLNALVLIVGCVVLTSGTTRFAAGIPR